MGGKKTQPMIDGGEQTATQLWYQSGVLSSLFVGSGLINDRATIKENLESIYKLPETKPQIDHIWLRACMVTAEWMTPGRKVIKVVPDAKVEVSDLQGGTGDHAPR